MNTIRNVVIALLVGFVTFVVTAIVGTEIFFPRIEFSLFVGVPAGLWAAIASTALLGIGLWHRDLPIPRSRTATAALWASIAVAVDVVIVFALTVVWFFGLGGNVAVLLLIYGAPVTMVVAAILGAGAALFRRDGGSTAGGNGRTDTAAR